MVAIVLYGFLNHLLAKLLQLNSLIILVSLFTHKYNKYFQ